MYSPIRQPIRTAIRSAVERRIGASSPSWSTLAANFEAELLAAGASGWYAPPDSYAARVTYGPFVGSDGSGGNPTLGSGQVGWFRDVGAGPVGSELVAPINFLSGWSSSGAAVTFNTATSFTAAGVANVTRSYLTIGRKYLITFNVSFTAGAVNIYNATNATNQINTFTINNGTSYSYVYTALAAQINIRPTAASTVTVNSISVRELPGNAAVQATSGNRPILVAAPGVAASGVGFAALSFVSTDSLVATMTSSGSPGYFDMQDNGTERTAPAAATTTTVTLQVPDGRRLVVAAAINGTLPPSLVTAARALGSHIRGA